MLTLLTLFLTNLSCPCINLPVSPYISLYLPVSPPLHPLCIPRIRIPHTLFLKTSLLTAKLAPCCNGGVQSLHCSGTIKEDAELNANVTLMVGGGDGSVIVYTVSNIDAAGYEEEEEEDESLYSV